LLWTFFLSFSFSKRLPPPFEPLFSVFEIVLERSPPLFSDYPLSPLPDACPTLYMSLLRSLLPRECLSQFFCLPLFLVFPLGSFFFSSGIIRVFLSYALMSKLPPPPLNKVRGECDFFRPPGLLSSLDLSSPPLFRLYRSPCCKSPFPFFSRL